MIVVKSAEPDALLAQAELAAAEGVVAGSLTTLAQVNTKAVPR